MSQAAPDFDPRRFRTTVAYYARYRLAYPDLLIRRVLGLVGIEPGEHVLDLGCGPGLLAIPFALAGLAVTAVDPEPDMLEATRQAAAAAGVEIDIRQGSSFALPGGIGPFRLAAMGRAFHWMDRAETLNALDRLIDPGGAVVLFDDEHPRTAENRWLRLLDEVSQRHGAGEAAHLKARKSPDYRRHESILLDSPFSVLESVGVIVSREIGADEIVGLAFSRSSTAPQKLGERAGAFEAELRQELAALSPSGHFHEIADLRALVARRP